MNAAPLSPDDLALIEAASALIRKRYAVGRHHIAAALRTRSGRIFTGLHLDTYVGRASVCAEAVAVGQAMADGAGPDDPVTAIVSVRHPRPTAENQEIDRKSVVEGKRVSVRVDRGGRRSIKKKKTKRQ